MKIWRMGQLGFYWRIFVKFRSWVFFENLSRKFVPRKSDKWNSSASTSGFLWMLLLSIFRKSVEKIYPMKNWQMEPLGFYWWIFVKFHCSVFFENLSKKFVPRKSNKWNSSAYTGGFLWMLLLSIFRKSVEKIRPTKIWKMEQFGFYWRIFVKFHSWVFFENLSRKFVPRKSDKRNSSASTGGFSWNFIVEYFSKICRENSSHENLTNGTAWLLLADFREIS